MIDKVKIGGVNYAIQHQKDLHTVDDEGRKQWANARCGFSELVIEVNEGLQETLLPQVIMHESLHCMLYHAGQTEQVEAHVLALGYSVVAFMRENPEYVRSVIGWEKLE